MSERFVKISEVVFVITLMLSIVLLPIELIILGINWFIPLSFLENYSSDEFILFFFYKFSFLSLSVTPFLISLFFYISIYFQEEGFFNEFDDIFEMGTILSKLSIPFAVIISIILYYFLSDETVEEHKIYILSSASVIALSVFLIIGMFIFKDIKENKIHEIEKAKVDQEKYNLLSSRQKNIKKMMDKNNEHIEKLESLIKDKEKNLESLNLEKRGYEIKFEVTEKEKQKSEIKENIEIKNKYIKNKEEELKIMAEEIELLKIKGEELIKRESEEVKLENKRKRLKEEIERYAVIKQKVEKEIDRNEDIKNSLRNIRYEVSNISFITKDFLNKYNDLRERIKKIKKIYG